MKARNRSLWATALAFYWAGVGPLGAVVEAPDLTLMLQESSIKTDLEKKIQTDILDPILGKDQAKVFVDIKMEVLAQRREDVKSGAGMRGQYKEKPGAKGFATQFILPGVPKPKNISPNALPEKPAASLEQTAAQERQEESEYFGIKPIVKHFQATIVHDEGLSQSKVALVRSTIVDALKRYEVTPDQIVFRPTRFNWAPWADDFRKPEVYIPLIYALLLFLLLGFLFGPLAMFMRRYIKSLYDEKPATQNLNKSEVDSKADTKGDQQGGKGGLGGSEESKLDIMLGRKPYEEPPPAEEDEAMKKFEPFAYINEENLKRLANMFLIRREEPWLIAVVLSYLKPEFSKQILGILPVELQSKVALEALKVRQVTREQVVAIDNEIKESVDFVVGGMERFVHMLEETDPATRNNILEYLKNEKPVLYQRVRNFILVFDDLVDFPDKDMQVIVRELKTEQMARALQGAPPEVVTKFIKNMSAGAASLLKESMEYTKGLTQSQVDDQRAKIMDLINNLEKESKINVLRARREKGMEGFQEEIAGGREEKLGSGKAGAEELLKAANAVEAGEAAAAQPNPEAAAASLQQGAQAMEAGRLDEAVQLFRKAIELDSTLWQSYQFLGTALYQMGRHSEALMYYEKLLEFNPDPQLKAWVDSFKAQVQ